MEPRGRAALFLFLFSAVSAELVTGSSPPVQFLILSPLLFGYYGLGVLSVHEATVRWRKGWPAALILGMAYGITEEGLTNLTFFNPNWATAGSYGRYAGVNWVWSISLTIVHSIISICIPILMTQLIFPAMKWERLLGPRAFRVVPVAFLSIAVFQYFFIRAYTGFSADPGLWLMTLALTVALVGLARRAPYHLFGRPSSLPRHRPAWFAFVGALPTFGGFITMAFLGALAAPFPLAMATWALSALGAAYLLERNLGITSNEMHKLALIVGLQSFFLFFDFILEISNPGERGMSVVSVAYIVFLLGWLRKRLASPPGSPMMPPSATGLPPLVPPPPGP